MRKKRTNSIISLALGGDTGRGAGRDSRHLAALALVVGDAALVRGGRGGDAGHGARGDLADDARDILSGDGGDCCDGSDEGEGEAHLERFFLGV